MAGRVAVKFAYEGAEFMGSQRQPRLRTAESEILNALVKVGAIRSAAENRFRVASRTDRGVNALGNVFAVDTEFRRQKLLSALNAKCQGVYCYAYAEVPDSFSPRWAKGRWYQYHLPYRGHDIDLMRSCAAEFQGEHEFCLFCKQDERATVRTLDTVEVVLDGNMIVIDLRAREFLRNMVRRIVSALDLAGQGQVSPDEIRSALHGQGRSLGLAEPEGLFLMDVDHGLEMVYGPLGQMPEKVTEMRDAAQVRLHFLQLLEGKTHLAKRSCK